MRLPLFGCIALVGLVIGFVFMIFIYGYFKVKAGMSKPAWLGVENARAKASSDSVPFQVPEGYVVRKVLRQHPCGEVSTYYVVMPKYDEPCGGSVR